MDRNTRDSKWWIIDDLAKLGGCTKMKKALVDLIDEYGIDYYEKAVYEMIEEGRRFAINKIKTVLFPGTYRTVNFYDVLNAEQPVRFQKNYYVHEPLEIDGHEERRADARLRRDQFPWVSRQQCLPDLRHGTPHLPAAPGSAL